MRKEEQNSQKPFEAFVIPDFPRIEKVIAIIHRLRNQKPGHVLDVGCCPGGFGQTLAELAYDCKGVDLFPRRMKGVHCCQADLNSGYLPFRNEEFDVLMAGEFIEHLYDDALFLTECNRVLRNGGILALTAPNLLFLANRLLILAGQDPLFVIEKYHYHTYTPRILRKLVISAGFRINVITSSHILFSRRRFPGIGQVFEKLGDLFPSLGAHIICIATKEGGTI